MSTPKEEYLMLREEILQLNTIINSTINFFYVFVSAVLLFAINQTDSLYVLLTYLIIFPAYAIALSKAIGTYRIGGYLYVFCEGSDFNWERSVNTSDSTYYKWTQWIFLQMFTRR